MQTLAVLAATVAVVAAIGNWWSRLSTAATATRVELVTKPVTTIAIGALAVALGVEGDAPAGAIVAAVVAFACCLTGDVALLPVVDRFVVGLAAFLVGHVAFVVMFVLLGLESVTLAVVALVLVAGVGASLGRRVVAGAHRSDPALAAPVVGYLAVISSMAVVGWATAIPAAVVGSALFVASDSFLGWRQFVDERRWMAPVVMITYHGALFGLALSLR
ncbi:MAG: lysoplasmalogenase [Ilumatobacteraceae bacterium]